MAAVSRMFGAIDMGSHWRPLQEGDVFREIGGTTHYVEYVNSSGAYCVPLTSVVREIQGQVINFQGGGRTISANSVVQILHPLELGGNSQEYASYVKLEARKGRKEAGMARKNAKGTAFGEFSDTPLTEAEVEANSTTATIVTASQTGETGMAKKTKANGHAKTAKAGNGAAKREKTPKTVRKCVCGCGADTTGHFAPGHDARFHGWIKKLAAGTMGPNEVPATVRKGLDLVQTKEGYKAKAPHYYKEA